MTPQERHQKVMALRQSFSPIIFQFEDQEPGAKVPFEYKIGKTDMKVAGVQGTCGCTEVKFKEDKITGLLSIDDKDRYAGQKGRKLVSKNILVYFDDGLPYKITNENGVIRDNPDKVIVNLEISGFVDLGK